MPLLKGHEKWKEEIGIFCELDPYQHISHSRFFEDMFDDFLRGPHDSEGAVADIRRIKIDLVAAGSS